MRRPVDVETYEDFKKYYSGGWISLESSNDKDTHHIPIQLYKEVDVGGVFEFHHIARDPEGVVELAKGPVLTWANLVDQASFGRPPIGMALRGDELVYMSGLAERQWARGLNLDRLAVYRFNSWHLRNRPKSDDGANDRFSLIYNLFNPGYKTFGTAFTLLQNGEGLGFPLSRRWGMYVKPDCPMPLLAYKRWGPFGYIPSPGQVCLAEQYKDYQDEIRQKFHTTVSIV